MPFVKTGEVTIEMFWTCSAGNCGQKNSGLSQSEDDSLRCTKCGKQKEDEPYFEADDIQNAPAITDEHLLRLADADKNWDCRFCGNQERDTENICSTCGAHRAEAERTTPVPIDEPASEPLAASTYSDIPLYRKRSTFRVLVGVLIACGVLFLVIVMCKWLFGTHLVTATVSKTTWERIENLQQKKLEPAEDWRNNLPTGSFDLSCENKIRTHVDCNPHKCRPHKVGYDCNCTGGDTYNCNGKYVRKNCRNKKNGAQVCDEGMEYDTCTHPKKCQTCYKTEYDTCYDRCPVRDDWCSASYYAWPEIKHEVKSGTNSEAFWPGLKAVGPDQRIQRFEIYQVTFAHADESWILKPKTGDEFAQYPFGARYKSEYNRAGSFKPIQRLSP